MLKPYDEGDSPSLMGRVGQVGRSRDVYMPIWLQESHLESDGFNFFFPGGIPNEIPRIFSFFQQNGIPGESQTLFLESFRQLLESHTRSSLFSGILGLFCVFQTGLGNRYLGRQKLVRLLVSSSV